MHERIKAPGERESKLVIRFAVAGLLAVFAVPLAQYFLHLSEASAKSISQLSGLSLALCYVFLSWDFEYSLLQINSRAKTSTLDPDYFTALFKLCMLSLVVNAIFIAGTLVVDLGDISHLKARHHPHLLMVFAPMLLAYLFRPTVAAWCLLIRAYKKL